MDVIGGLTAAKLALDLAKDLREIDKSVDEAAFKMKLAELMSALSNAQVALAEAKSQINGLKEEVDVLKNGDVCPKCRQGRVQLVENKPTRSGALHRYGVEDWYCECDNSNCDFSQRRLHDPLGVATKFAAKE
jgi:hypothetical protein